MDLLPAESFKTFVDIGLGAVSLMLWFRQGKVNKAHLKAAEDLTTMVRDHEVRITSLESRPGSMRRRRAKTHGKD